VAKQGFKVVLDGNGADEILGGYPWHDATKPLRPQLEHDLLSAKLPRVLRMNDRLSMAHGVELRSPFLDYRLVEFCFSLPDRFKIRDGHRKWLLRYAMGDWRPKVQQTDTLKLLTGPLRPYVEEIVNSPEFASRGPFDTAQGVLWDAPKVQSEYLALCKTGAGQEHDRTPAPIWRYISTELWFREFVDKCCSVA
jgi:asparagine synthetase B (glutamine-hydrolysing)